MAPNSGLVLQGAGWVLAYVGAYDEAIDCFERTIRYDPLGQSTGYYRSGMGICQVLSGQVEAGLVSLELGYADNPDFASAILPLMNTYHLLGRMADAKALADKVMRLVPDYTISGNLAVQPFQLPEQRAFVARHSQGLGLPP
jgi:tetratricopeptide (TPR) repeat protein